MSSVQRMSALGQVQAHCGAASASVVLFPVLLAYHAEDADMITARARLAQPKTPCEAGGCTHRGC